MARKAIISCMSLFVSRLLRNMRFAYVGPGAGIAMLGALWAVLLGVLVSVGASYCGRFGRHYGR
jgi:hypothetical protein